MCGLLKAHQSTELRAPHELTASDTPQPAVYDVLLCLADFCAGGGVRACATRLLDALPTDARALGALRGALAAPAPDQALGQLLAGAGGAPPGAPRAGAPTRLARLLYTLQVRRPARGQER